MKWYVKMFDDAVALQTWLRANILVADVANVKFTTFDAASGKILIIYLAP